MAKEPWLTPLDVQQYSEIEAVQKREPHRLETDIARAQSYIINYTHDDFKLYLDLPTAVKTAALLIAEAYAYNSAIAANSIKSETFDEYSYTVETSQIEIESLDVSALLAPYVRPVTHNDITLRLRRL